MSAPRNFVRMFKPQFAGMVEAGTKTQTVRPTPARMPRPGDRISLRTWTGKPYRSKQRILREATISNVQGFRIDSDFEGPFITLYCPVPFLLSDADARKFAQDDGFPELRDLAEWFENEHGLPFSGIVIFWSGGPP